MPRPVRAILIDPYAGTVTEVTHDADDFHEIYKLLSGEPHDVGTFTCVHLDDGDAIYVDDEGLCSSDDRRRPFKWVDYPQPLMGRGLILGSNNMGETVACKLTLEQARERVQFAPPCFRPKRKTAATAHVRAAVGRLMDEGDDDDVNQFARVVAMGKNVEQMLEATERAGEVAEKLGIEHGGAGSSATVTHNGQRYLVTVETVEREQATGPKPEPEVAEKQQ